MVNSSLASSILSLIQLQGSMASVHLTFNCIIFFCYEQLSIRDSFCVTDRNFYFHLTTRTPSVLDMYGSYACCQRFCEFTYVLVLIFFLMKIDTLPLLLPVPSHLSSNSHCRALGYSKGKPGASAVSHSFPHARPDFFLAGLPGAETPSSPGTGVSHQEEAVTERGSRRTLPGLGGAGREAAARDTSTPTPPAPSSWPAK